MSTEAHVYMRHHQGAKVKHFDVSNVIYHKFSHGAVSYTLNGENVDVMLESLDNVMSYKSYDHTCNNTLTQMRNVTDNIRVSNAFSH